MSDGGDDADEDPHAHEEATQRDDHEQVEGRARRPGQRRPREAEVAQHDGHREGGRSGPCPAPSHGGDEDDQGGHEQAPLGDVDDQLALHRGRGRRRSRLDHTGLR